MSNHIKPKLFQKNFSIPEITLQVILECVREVLGNE